MKITTQQLLILTFCMVAGFVAKRVVMPFTAILTDFVRIPGGSLATGFALAFLVIGVSLVPVRGAGTLMGFVQGAMALFLGMSGYQGALALVTYTLPGLVIDLCAAVMKERDVLYFMLTCVLSNTACALFSNALVFHLHGLSLLLWVLMGALSGIAGGLAAGLHRRAVRYRIVAKEECIMNRTRIAGLGCVSTVLAIAVAGLLHRGAQDVPASRTAP